MTVLVIAEHDNAALKPATLHAVTAAAKLGRHPYPGRRQRCRTAPPKPRRWSPECPRCCWPTRRPMPISCAENRRRWRLI